VSLSFLGNHDEGDAMTGQAVRLAEEFGGGLLGAAYFGRCVHHWYWGELNKAMEAGMRGAEICRSTRYLAALANGLPYLQVALATLGQIDDAARIGEEFQPLTGRMGNHGCLLPAAVARSLLMVTTGHLEAFERLAHEDLVLCRNTGMPCDGVHVRLGLIAFWRGHWEQALNQFEEASRRELPGTALEGTAWAFRLLFRSYLGDRQGVLALSDEWWGSRFEPCHQQRLGVLTSLLVLPEALAVVGAMREAAAFYPAVTEVIESGAVVRTYDATLVQLVAGICAAGSEDWPRAEEHYRIALRQSHELPHRIAQPEVRRWLAHMLLRRDAPGDHSEALTLLGEAVRSYRLLEMPRHLEMVEALLAEGGVGRSS
jgi:tetratricopeptide (TPR) repeat protein